MIERAQGQETNAGLTDAADVQSQVVGRAAAGVQQQVALWSDIEESAAEGEVGGFAFTLAGVAAGVGVGAAVVTAGVNVYNLGQNQNWWS